MERTASKIRAVPTLLPEQHLAYTYIALVYTAVIRHSTYV